MQTRVLLSFLLLLIGTQQAALAHRYCPFRPGLLYQLTQSPGDTIYSLRLQKQGGIIGSDSIYSFNRRLGPHPTNRTSACGTQLPFALYRYAENLFGATLRITAAATARPEYVLQLQRQALNSTFVLKPYAPLNQLWFAGGGVNAWVSSRSVATVLGQPDSVVSITFSDGRVLRLSKTYGFVGGPTILDYFSPRRPVRNLALTALPTQRLGQAVFGPLAVYDFQPGDVFWYQYTHNSRQPGASYSFNYGDSVLTRTASRTGDTLTYRLWRCSQNRTNAYVHTLTVSNTQPALLAAATGQYVRESRTSTMGTRLHDAIVNYLSIKGRPVLRHEGRMAFICSPADTSWVTSPPIDYSQEVYYSTGLGMILSYDDEMTATQISTILIGYRKGPDWWGTTYPLCRPVLSAAARQPAGTAVALPNPFTRDLSLQVTVERTQVLAVSLFNHVGQQVWAARQPVTAGEQRVPLALPALPAGLYFLHLRHDGRTEVLKVLRAQ
ncbi:T9SS type A sorting domain-containing protein [Hymenobacter koreensis]|uniref:T9SS type A sorting domain-containing protein n=1 Tax=Hymenobacter koreensis TaxID=1084523 RepID=A0ABP8JJ78_9BACT